jgi:transcriptional/translational regulatory protein YebC/TACO1
LIIAAPNNLEAVRESLTKAKLEIASAEVVMSPSSSAEMAEKDAAKQLMKLLDALESHDDVQQVYSNFEMSEDWMAELV